MATSFAEVSRGSDGDQAWHRLGPSSNGQAARSAEGSRRNGKVADLQSTAWTLRRSADLSNFYLWTTYKPANSRLFCRASPIFRKKILFLGDPSRGPAALPRTLLPDRRGRD